MPICKSPALLAQKKANAFHEPRFAQAGQQSTQVSRKKRGDRVEHGVRLLGLKMAAGNSYISVREREEIAETPIQQAMKDYRETRGVLLVVYALLIGALPSNAVTSVGPGPAQVPSPPTKPP
jgi:hypothetical protein